MTGCHLSLYTDKSGVESQPEISLAPYQIPYRTKRRVDNYCGKIESDPDFLKWSAEQGVAVAVSVWEHVAVTLIIVYLHLDL